MRTFSEILAIPLAASFLLAAGCSGSPCEKAADNKLEFTMKDGSEVEKKKVVKEIGDHKDAAIALCEALIEKYDEIKAQVECQAKATDYKSLKACDSAGKDAKKDSVKKDDTKKDEHK